MGIETPLRGEHESLHASFGEWFGCALPEHYTNFAAEYRAARETAGVFDACTRTCFVLTGDDRVRYLNAVVTNNIKDLAAGQGTVALLLNPQGHILAELECLTEADRILVLSHSAVRERSFTTLEKFIIMDDATLEDRTDATGMIAVAGPRAGAIVHRLCGLELAGLSDYAHVKTNVGGVPCRIVRQTQFGGSGAEFIVDRPNLVPLWRVLLAAVRDAGGAPIGYSAVNALRLEAGVPWFGYDFDDKVIPQEAALEATHVSFTKGCYTGQEIVERVRSRGHVNRRRVGLKLSGEAVPPAGDKLLADEKEVGFVTSAAYSPANRCAIGMGYVRREYTVSGTVVQSSKGPVEIVEHPEIRN